MKGFFILFVLFVASVTSQTCPNMKGDRGDRGLPGRDGIQGLPGLPGSPGFEGPKGFRGIDGTPGLPGFNGQKGEKGLRGPPSAPGPKPIPGEQGDKGEKGPRGGVGIPGFPGRPGLPGKDGVTGPIGIPGPQGDCEEEGTCPHVAFAGQALGVEQNKEEQVVAMNVLSNSCQEEGCYNSKSGFTAPFSGVYTFGITAVANGDSIVPLILYKNDDAIATTARSSSTAMGILPHSTIQVNVALETGDTVALKVGGTGSGIGSTVTGWFRDPTDVILIAHTLEAP